MSKSNKKNKGPLKPLPPIRSSNDPGLTGEKVLNNGAPVTCGGTQCCNSQVEARFACNQQLAPGVDGKTNGQYYGYSNISAQQIPREDKNNYVDCVGTTGHAYACYANDKASCPTRNSYPYNKDGQFGSHRPSWQPQSSSDFLRGDAFCREKNGPNAVMSTHRDGMFIVSTGCDIYDWTTQPLEQCCAPGSQTMPGLYESNCGPQTCFGKPACDKTDIVEQICSDKDNVAKDQACIDTCLRSNDTNSVRWCNPQIKKYCQGKNLETEVCRTYCTQDSIDQNPELAQYCDGAYVQYCKSTNYKTYDRKTQDKLCGCINSPLLQANCVDNKCTNGIAIKTKSLRDNKGQCPDNVCISQIYIDPNNTGNIDINIGKWNQICPGVAPPGSDPNNPFAKKSIQNLEWYIGGPLLLALLVVALVFLFK